MLNALKTLARFALLAVTLALVVVLIYVNVTGNIVGNPDVFALIPAKDLHLYQ